MSSSAPGESASKPSGGIWLVVPCYRESRRLPAFLRRLVEGVEKSGLPCRIQVVDDGSGERERRATREVVEQMRRGREAFLCPLLEERHQGKGGAILSGWKAAPTAAAFYAFVDADGAVPAEEVVRLGRRALEGDPAISYFASRRNTATTTVKRNPVRRFNGRCYAWLVSFVFATRIYDPACGLKLLSGSFYREVGELLSEKGWALDLEILARSEWHEFPVEEIPVNWEEKGGSKIVSGDVLRILRDLFRIVWRSRHW